ncbi:hypothetical protein BEP19_16590 [Ammoniphilus oxalaticus]|uniref:Lipoprotein n=1 Tax=Ammoniphilus oxalaticus TaxID=66863 RepID=A0A419SQP2_9BACL|nr:hypothetical protein [Ammoniphilus oxalaticus]RKD26812.1 hypothetical protein BEP19_16590 [Ammoniphilus oxalaticus]
MKKLRLVFWTLLVTQLILTGCSQEKVMDTEFIRLKNNVKDIELALKQREDEAVHMSQKLTNLEETVKRQKEEISQLMAASPQAQSQDKHPVIIQDIQVTSEQMDANGRVWGPFDLNITLYNGTDHPIADSVSALIVSEDPLKNSHTPKVEQIVKRFEIGPKESKIVRLEQLPINHPTKRLNVVVKLLENTRAPNNAGVPGKATWVVIPTVIFPPDNP